MAQLLMGDMLKRRRRELGFSLEDAAQATNIRARTLAVFEEGDYKNYPPSGYVQGMLSSYAKFLRLDPRAVLDAYSREYAEFSEKDEIATAANRVRTGRGRYGEHKDMGTQPMARSANMPDGELGQLDERLAQEHYARHDDRYKSGSVKVVSRSGGQTAPRRFSRRQGAPTSYSSRQPYHVQSSSSYAATGAQASSVRSSAGEHDSSSRSSRRSNRTAASRTGTGERIVRTPEVSSVRRDDKQFEDYKLSSTSSGSSRRQRRQKNAQSTSEDTTILGRIKEAIRSVLGDTKSRIIALAVLLLVIAVFGAANILISTAGNDTGEVINVQGGAEDTTKTDTNSKNATATITTTNGNPISVHIEVAEGSTSLVNVTFDDDNAYNGTAVGPWSRDFQVTESMSATFGNPDAVKVTENGNEVQVERNEDGTGKITLKIKTTSTATDKEESKS